MTDFITNSFQSQLANTVRMAVQQKMAKVAPTFTIGSFKGEGAQVADYLKAAPAPQKNRASKTDTTYFDIDTLRRWIYPNTYNWDILVDQFDKLKTLNDPSNMYQQAGSMAMARQRDDECIGAFFASANTGKNGSTAVTFPAGQQVAATVGGGASAVGLNVEKLLAGRAIFMANQVDLDNEEVYCVITSVQERNLQNEIKMNNKDYNTAYDINTGRLSKLFNINFVYCERLLLNGSSQYRVPLYCKSGMQLGIWKDIEATVYEKVATKNNNAQFSLEQAIGATRTEEEKVVELICA